MPWAEIKIKGAEELMNKFENLQKQYPDFSIKAMSSVGTKFTKENRKTVQSLLRGKTKDNYKRLTSGFGARTVGYGSNVTVQWHGENKKNPDWHLVEKGHELVAPNRTKNVSANNTYHLVNGSGQHVTWNADGRTLGYVPGIHSVERTTARFSPIMAETLEKKMMQIIKKNGL
jgi:hypothetical protein